MDTEAFEKRVIGFVREHRLFRQSDRVLLAISGGADSVALLHILHRYHQSGLLQHPPLCVHFNHQLRHSEADRDAAFVQALTTRLGLACQRQTLRVKDYAREHHVSIETAAREMRMHGLTRWARSRHCTVIATGHHQDDNAETVVQRLGRGTGFRGLAGIRPKRVLRGFNFISPLLCTQRSEIRSYLRARRLPWRDDASNSDCSFRRNFIRHQLLPALQEGSTAPMTASLARLSAQARRLHERITEHTTRVYPSLSSRVDDCIVLKRAGFLKQPRPIQVELIRRVLVDFGCGERDLSARHYQGVVKLAQSNSSGRQMHLPGGMVACIRYNRLEFSRPATVNPPVSQGMASIEVAVPGITGFGPYVIETAPCENRIQEQHFFQQKSRFIEYLDWDQLELPVSARLRRPGDRFCPLGRRTPQKLGRFLTNAKVMPEKRDRVLVLTDARRVIWVYPIRLSNEVRITPGTKRILKIQIQFDERA